MRLRAHWGLSSGQTIGAARTAVRSACYLPERPVANRLRRLYPLDTRFPTFPPAPPSGSLRINGVGVCDCGRTKGLPSSQTIIMPRNTLRSPECHRLIVPQKTLNPKRKRPACCSNKPVVCDKSLYPLARFQTEGTKAIIMGKISSLPSSMFRERRSLEKSL